MADDFADASFAEAMDSFTQQMQLISGLQQQRARLTVSASGRVRPSDRSSGVYDSSW
ncbi:hypothetical protein OHB12_02870 [Nocardia sp. NBC_01730]|uniref:hypothetical protein n=1 Tax=Nocardia sp. NBC_01730 TaxID=2975998 RepID=UPI002E0D4266|nr:hypothetical protein OHB12_02870 [Nocardia sp. NBC_01730]